MIDVSSMQAPGWQKLVEELASPAADDKAFLDRLLRILLQVAAARQAVLFIPSAGSSGEAAVRPLAVYPPLPASPDLAGGAAPPAEKLEQGTHITRAAYACMESGKSRVFELGSSDLYDGSSAGSAGFVLAIGLPSEVSGSEGDRAAGAADASKPALAACVTLLIEPRSKAAVQSTLAMAEVLGGFVHTHAIRQHLKRLQAAGRSLELATRLIGAVNNAPGFRGACLQLCNDLAKMLKADRVAVGWASGGSDSTVRVVAMSDIEHFDKRTAMVRKLQSAMDECLDSGMPVMHPKPTSEQDMLLATAIAHAHRELAGGDRRLAIASVPLRSGDVTLGVLTVEAKTALSPMGGPSGDPTAISIDPASVELLQSAMDLLSPVLKVRHDDDRNLALRTWDSTRRAGSWIVGTRHTVWKMVGVLVLAAVLFCTFYTTTYRVGADGELRAREKRIISVPFEGSLASKPAEIEPGVFVKQGQLLAQMDTTELRLQAAEAEARLVQAEKAMSQAMKESKISEAKKSEAQADAARAQLDLLLSRIERSRIVAPIDGTLISGDLRDKVGAAVKLGDELFQIAPLGGLLAVAKVDERDIARIEVGKRGQIATRANPTLRFDLMVETIVPLGVAAEGKTVFEVRTALEKPAGWMRPGMEGVIRLDAGKHSLLYIGTRRVIETVRLWVW